MTGLFGTYLRGQMRRAAERMADDKGINAHRVQRQHGVFERLAFDGAAGRPGEAVGIRRHDLGRRLERSPGARARLEKQRGDGFAAQGRHFLDRPGDDLLERLRPCPEDR